MKRFLLLLCLIPLCGVGQITTPDAPIVFSSSAVAGKFTQTLFLTADKTFSTSALADIAGISFTLSPLKTYRFEYNLRVSADGANGLGMACSCSGTPSQFSHAVSAFGGTNPTFCANNTTVVANKVGGASGGGGPQNAQGFGMVTTDATASPVFKFRAATDNGSTTFTIKAGSYFTVTEM